MSLSSSEIEGRLMLGVKVPAEQLAKHPALIRKYRARLKIVK